MDDLLKVFLAETTECLVECQGDLEQLREAPDDTAALDNILRLIRSVRETSGFLGMPALQVAANAAIDGLEAARARLPASADRIVAMAADSLAQIKVVVDGLATDAPAPAAATAPSPAVLATKRPTRKKKAAAETKPAEPDEEGSDEPSAQATPAVASVSLAPAALPASVPAPAASPLAAAPQPSSDGTVRVSADMLENLLSTVSRLMAAQTEMMQLLKTKESVPAPLPVPVESPVTSAELPATPAPEASAIAPSAVENAFAPPRDASPISSDGKVVSLQAHQAAVAARVVSETIAASARSATATPIVAATPAPPASGPTHRFLVFHAADKTARAVILDRTTRVEQVDVAAIDGSRGLWVMRSGGDLFPLVPFDSAYRVAESGRAPVIIFSIEGQSFGLLVDSVQEVGDAVLATAPAKRVGRLGTVQLDGATVDVIDPVYYLNEAVQTRFRLGRRNDAKSRAPRPERPAIPEGDDLFVRKPAR